MTSGDSPSEIAVGSATDVGRVRAQNEDAFYADPEHGIFIVADGMGGHQAGEIASKVVVSVLPKMIEGRMGMLGNPRSRAIRYWLRQDILQLSQRLHSEATQKTAVRGTGATVVMALLRGDRAHIAHMGDSRAYLFRDNRLTQLTEDHSVVGLLQRSGEITAEEAKTHPARSHITRYVGMSDPVYPDVRTVPLKPGDRLLLCTDGLTGMLSDEEIAEALRRQSDPQKACDYLVQAANSAGGKDNATVVVVNRI